jgi:aminoglycoside 3-N-acetyltransferase
VQVSVAEVLTQLEALGVRGGSVLLVHTSYRAVGPIEGGAHGLIHALLSALGPEGTLVMPTMTDGESVFDPRATPTHEMGITAELFWRMPGTLRSTHPGGSFAARGPLAERICAPQPLAPPHGIDSPPGRVLELDGQVLLLGVDHSENTTLHVAESLAGVPYSVEHPCVIEPGVTVMIAETDHCCRGFRRMNEWLDRRGLQRQGPVGHGHARLVRSRDVVEVALSELRSDPFVFLCPEGSECEECAAARAG